jgi:hypothetical protein
MIAVTESRLDFAFFSACRRVLSLEFRVRRFRIQVSGFRV